MNFRTSTFLCYVSLLSIFAAIACVFSEAMILLDIAISISFFTTNILFWFYLIKRVVDEVVVHQVRPAVGILFFMKQIALLMCVGGMVFILSLPSIITGILVVVSALLLSGLPFGLVQELSNGR